MYGARIFYACLLMVNASLVNLLINLSRKLLGGKYFRVRGHLWRLCVQSEPEIAWTSGSKLSFPGATKCNFYPCPNLSLPSNLRTSPQKQADLWAVFNQHHGQGVVILVPAEEKFKGFAQTFLLSLNQMETLIPIWT